MTISGILRKNSNVIRNVFGPIKESGKDFIIDQYGYKYTVYTNNEHIVFERLSERGIRVVILPLTIDANEISIVREIELDKRKDGFIYENIIRNFGPSARWNKEDALTDLKSIRYTCTGPCIFPDNDFTETPYIPKNKIKLTTIFESHMRHYIKPIDEARAYTDTPYPTKTLINGLDISEIYDTVDGEDKISRIFDLYRGRINAGNKQDIKAIELGLLSKTSFGYKRQSKIDASEDEYIGASEEKRIIGNREEVEDILRSIFCSEKEYDINDIDSIIKIIRCDLTEQNRSEYFPEGDTCDIKEKKPLIKRLISNFGIKKR